MSEYCVCVEIPSRYIKIRAIGDPSKVPLTYRKFYFLMAKPDKLPYNYLYWSEMYDSKGRLKSDVELTRCLKILSHAGWSISY